MIEAKDEQAVGSSGVTRVCVLFSRLSGYMAACLKALRERYGVELLVIRQPPASNAPFQAHHFDWIDYLHDRNTLSRGEIDALVRQFSPQVIFMSGWFDKAYLQVARDLKREGVMIVAGSDAQWTGSLRQQVGRVIAPWYLHSAIDVLWVSGERQRQLARRLGYTGSRCWSGVYACDWDRFAEVYAQRNDTLGKKTPPFFLYVGRYVSVKGLDVLVEAYRQYRALVPAPWSLICAGAGEQQHLLGQQPGIENRGFVQPDQLPALMQDASAFVLPSRREPWGVVVQEAAAAGLPLLCSDASGATVHLLQDGYNGYLFESGNATQLARSMAHLTEASTTERQQMGHRSHLLSKQYTPQRWAATLTHGVEAYRRFIA